jgi:hypothetical protein
MFKSRRAAVILIICYFSIITNGRNMVNSSLFQGIENLPESLNLIWFLDRRLKADGSWGTPNENS